MPMNNPFDRELTPTRRRISNIGFFVTTAFVVLFIVWMLIRQTSNIRTDFDHVEGQFISITNSTEEVGENEFNLLYKSISKGALSWSPDFISSYPKSAALLNMDKSVYNASTPYVLDDGDMFSLAFVYQDITNKNLRHMDVLMLSYSSKSTEKFSVISLSNPIRYTLTYSLTDGAITGSQLRLENYRLSFYSIGLNLICEKNTTSKINYKIELNSVISDNQAKTEGLLDALSTTPASGAPALTRNEESSALDGVINVTGNDGTAFLKLNFNDSMYDYFSGLKITSDIPLSGFKIGLN